MNALGLLVLLTALTAGVGRYSAVLARKREKRVEVWTAVGFFSGLVLGVAALGINWVSA